MSDLKAVFNVNQNERFYTGINHIKVLANCKEPIELSLVLTGEPVKYATYDKNIKDLIDLGVEVSVCNNTLIHFDIDKQFLIKGVKVVLIGALELIKKQNAGWSYLKP